MPSKRLELTVSQELWDQVEEARGVVPRAKWVKLALEAFLKPGPPVHPGLSDDQMRVRAEELRASRALQNGVVRPQVARAQFVRAASLVTPEIRSEWAEIMAARQVRLNKKRDGAA